LIPELSSLRVNAFLADVDDGRVSVGMPATVTLDGYPGTQFAGKVSSISAVAQESARQSLRRAFRVVVDLGKIDVQRMRPGFSARVTVERDRKPSVLIAPRAALDLSSPKTRARTASGRFVPVTLGPCNAQDCVVAVGLEEGARLARIDGGGHG
jgi:multidrug efflux pump subunit AcrA (membrane-fusion protein)